MDVQGKVLIIDDIDDNRHLLKIMMEREGWEVIETNDGCHAAHVARKEQPDVILMDYNMPFTNGVQACRELKDDLQTAQIPVLIYTGMNDLDIRQEALKAGAIDFLQKPLRPPQLREAITKAHIARVG